MLKKRKRKKDVCSLKGPEERMKTSHRLGENICKSYILLKKLYLEKNVYLDINIS